MDIGDKIVRWVTLHSGLKVPIREGESLGAAIARAYNEYKLEIARRFREKQNAAKRLEENNTAVLAQSDSGGESDKPKSMEGNYEDFQQLTLSEQERKAFALLHEKALNSNNEYGIIETAEGFSDPFSSDIHGRVYIDLSEYSDHLSAFHSHTDDSLFSSSDFSLLGRAKIDRIGLVTRNGDLFTAELGDLSRPSEAEIQITWDTIHDYVENNLIEVYRNSGITVEELNYFVIRETAYRLSNEFGFILKGGPLNE